LGIECRQDDETTLKFLAQFNNVTAQLESLAERAFLATLEGGCNLPAAALARVSQEELIMTGAFQADGQPLRRLTLNGPLKSARLIGQELARRLRDGSSC
jgi:hydroxymethylbilane synthase